MWKIRTCLVLTIVLVAAGCGNSTQLETSANPTPTAPDATESATAVPEHSESPDSTAPTTASPTTADSATVTTLPPALASADETRSLPDGPICDWLYAAEFHGDEVWIDFETASVVDVSIDDYADKWAVTCVNDTLVSNSDAYSYSLSYPLMLRVENGSLLVEADNSEWEGAVESTSYMTWDEAVAQEPWPEGLEGAGETAMLAIEALLSDDPALYESLLAEQLLSIQRLTPVSRAEVASYLVDDGLPYGEDYSKVQMRDYLSTYRPMVSPIDLVGEDGVSAFEELAPDATLAVFVGHELKAGRKAILWDDLLVFVLAGDSDGWRIVGI